MTYYDLFVPAQEGSSVATFPVALDPASVLGRVLALPHVPRLQTPPPCSGGLRRCHMSRGSQRVANLRNKEMLSWPRHAARLVRYQGTLA
jgi:hypothetical protein